jgi:hypothetical protein
MHHTRVHLDKSGLDLNNNYILVILLFMIGKCDECGMENVEVKYVKKANSDEKVALCNQCRPADGAYAY